MNLKISFCCWYQLEDCFFQNESMLVIDTIMLYGVHYIHWFAGGAWAGFGIDFGVRCEASDDEML